MKICFFHTNFDRDVSSGTSHSLSQWNELLMAFNIKEIAIINETNDEINSISSNITVKEYNSFNEFINNNEKFIFVEQNGKENYREHKYKKGFWYIFGSYKTLPKADINIETNGVALYCREAAAIILAEASWQLH